jgi:signal transduction histidine kinase
VQQEQPSRPPAGAGHEERSRRLLAMLALIAAMFVAGRLALVTANPTGFVSAVWPPAGLAMAALLYYGPRAWIVPFAGSLAINVTIVLPDLLRAPGEALGFPLATAIASTVAAVAGATGIRRATGKPVHLVGTREILAFAAWGGGITPALAALGGATGLLVTGRIQGAAYGFTWLTWFVGDSIGILIFTPVLLALLERDQPLWRQRRLSVVLPLLAACAFVLGFFMYNRERFEARQAQAVSEVAERLRRLLRQELAGELEFLHALETVYGVVDTGDDRAFHALARHRLDESPMLAAVTWLPEIATGVHRATWVATRSSDTLTPSTAISADQEIPRALARARLTGALVATAMRPRMLGQGDAPVLWVFTPVPRAALAERQQPVRGYFGVALSLDTLIAPLLGLARSADVHAWLEDSEPAADAPPRVTLDAHALDPAALSELARRFMAVREVRIADRAWRLHVAPTMHHLSGADSLALWLTLSGSLGFTAILGIFLLSFSGRHAIIASQVAERTAALTQAKLHLEREVAERERAQSSLARAAEVAEAASRAKTRFLNTMSHEVRTPMNAVIGMTELLSFTELDPEQRECVDAIRDAGTALLSLVNDVLDMARIESGRVQLDPRPFELRETVQSVCVLLGARARGQDLALRLDLAADAPDIMVGDANRLRQVLVNLVGNAIKFTERGSVTIAVAVHAREPEAVTLCFQVADTGIGIPEDKREIIFEAFEQGDPALARRFGGTGLGLSIAAELVRLMNGRIWVDSEIGKGSVFSFTARFDLPGDTAASTPSGDGAAASPPGVPNPPHPRR